MNRTKIAALYAAVDYPALLAFAASGKAAAYSLSDPIAYRVGHSLAAEAHLVGPNGRTYGVNVKNMDSTADRGRNSFGERLYYEAEAKLSERVHAWAVTQLPRGVDHHAVGAAGQDVWSAMVMQYAGPGEASVMELTFGAKKDFEVLMRGVRAYARKEARRIRKVLAQLAAYHAVVESNALRRGEWRGAEKALTTAARVPEPGVPFFGDVAHKPGATLAYWAVPANAGMETHFPAGTGLALKQITRSRDIVDGAVYVWQWQWGKEAGQSTTLIGRCDMGAKEHGHLPLRHEGAADVLPMLWLSWEKPEIKVYRVTHYTTHAAQPVQMVAETQPVRTQRVGQFAELEEAA